MFSFNTTGMQDQLGSFASLMFNALVPIIGITAGIGLGVGLAGKVISAIKGAF